MCPWEEYGLQECCCYQEEPANMKKMRKKEEEKINYVMTKDLSNNY